MFSLGKATSGEPICSGIRKLANPTKSAVANSSSMIEPCIVNSWLYCSSVTICRPGWNSSARMISAIRPAIRKNVNDVPMYSRPIVL